MRAVCLLLAAWFAFTVLRAAGPVLLDVRPAAHPMANSARGER